MPNDYGAGPVALGYLYQARYALRMLMDAGEEAELSIEKFDDVAFEKNGEAVQLIQTKHHVRTTGSLSDASKDLWATLRVWSDALRNGDLDSKAAVLTLVTTGAAPQNSAASLLRPTGRDSRKACEILSRVAVESKNRDLQDHFAAFTRLDESARRALLERVHVLDSSPSIQDVKAEITERIRLFCRSKHLDGFYERLEGWWLGTVIDHLSGGSTGTILYRELHSEINDLRDQFTEENLPIDFLDAVVPDEAKLPSDQRVFIRQLRLVAVGNPRIRTAIGDFYRAYQQRSKWVREDLLVVGDLEKYERKLTDEWSRLFDIMKEELPDATSDDIKKREGRALYNTIQKRTDIPIRPHVTEPYVQRGTYHILANKSEVGWHPDFVDRLRAILAPAAKVER